MGEKNTASAALQSFVRAALLWPAACVTLALPLVVRAEPDRAGAIKSERVVAVLPESRNARPATLRKSKQVAVGYTTARVRYGALRPSAGQLAGLRRTPASLDLKSSAALVVDQETNQVLLSKNANVTLPIASLTKLMTAVVVAEAKLPLDEVITVTQDDVDTEKGSRSRLKVGTQLSRKEMLQLALMASENRAAHALGRSFPGGSEAFVTAMNAKAQSLGMEETNFVESTGLSSRNKASARDLATLVRVAHEYPIIREMSTAPNYQVEIGRRNFHFHNTNRLVNRADWDIGLQKTGYITEAGRCLVMQANLGGRPLIMIFLDSAGKYSRLGDAERVRRWLIETTPWIPSGTPDAKLTS